MLPTMFLDKKFIGQKLKEYRKKASLSQEQVAEKTGLAEKHYGRLERGACMPTLETFFKLIEFLNIRCQNSVQKLKMLKTKAEMNL